MADRTLTINHADGGSETYTINRDKFAGVRDMVIDGANVSVDHTAVPKEQSKETTFGGSQSITVNRDIEPLLSKVVGGAAAAYSLRDLNDSQGNNKVVRVRRSSDNAERDFTASEMGEALEDWVNADITLYTQSVNLNIPSGSGTFVTLPSYAVENTIGHTFRVSFKLKRNTGGVGTSGPVSVRTISTWNYTTLEKSSNLTEKPNRFEINTSTEEYQTYSFTCSTNAGSSEGFLRFQTYDSNDSYTVKDFNIEVIESNGYVETCYDQSGNGNDATQTVAESQPKIVDAGTYLGEIDFDGSNDGMDISGLALASLNYGAFAVASIDDPTASNLRTIFDSTDFTDAGFALAYGNTASKLTPFWFDGDDTTANVFGSGSNLTSSESLYSVIIKSGASTTHINGSLNQTLTNTWATAGTNSFTKSTIGYNQTTPGRNFSGKLKELIIYETDQSSNRPAIEANILNQYDI